MVVAVLSSAGLHVPVMPLVDVVGKAASAEPEHIGATALNKGTVFALTTTVSVVVVAHNPAVGAKV